MHYYPKPPKLSIRESGGCNFCHHQSMVIGVVSFLLRKKMLFCKEKRTNEGVKEGKPSKTFWPSSWLGQILLVAEEILRSKYLHEMHLLWMEESPVNPISH